MSILNYFKPKDGLPNPKGPLSLLIPSQAIALANREGYHNITIVRIVGLPLTNQLFTNCCRPYFLINMAASNTAGSFELFHDKVVNAHCAVGRCLLPTDVTIL